jgi:hypothetical protein
MPCSRCASPTVPRDHPSCRPANTAFPFQNGTSYATLASLTSHRPDLAPPTRSGADIPVDVSDFLRPLPIPRALIA